MVGLCSGLSGDCNAALKASAAIAEGAVRLLHPFY